MKENLPIHIGIIVDGNGRWAKELGYNRSKGHKEGSKNLKKIALYAFSKGIKVLSVFLFSTENFKRDKEEVDYLMNLFINSFKKEFKIFNEKNVKVVFSNEEKGLPQEVLTSMKKIEELTKNNTAGILNVCINYGGRREIVSTSKKLIQKVLDKSLNIDDIDEEYFKHNLYQDLPDIDLLIRTSGELRISNFMLYQSSYAEFYFPKTYFPAFTTKDFDEAIREYNKRQRRYGGIEE